MNKEYLRIYKDKTLMHEYSDHAYIIEQLFIDLKHKYVLNTNSIKRIKRVTEYSGYEHYNVYYSNGCKADYYVKEL